MPVLVRDMLASDSRQRRDARHAIRAATAVGCNRLARITGEHVTNQNGHLARLESRRTSMSRAGTALIEHPTILSEYEK